MAGRYTLTVREGARVFRDRFDTLEAALAGLRARAEDLGGTARRGTVDLRYRQFEPVAQVAARLELKGPGRVLPRVRAGIDLRGDGSAEAFTGRTSRRVVEQEDGESPADALTRVLKAP